jgi:twinkle protein
VASETLLSGEAGPLPSRKITEETCQKFGYIKSTLGGKAVQVAPYYNADGQMIGQKVRGAGKKFTILGTVDGALPFGAQLWQKTGKKIVVTEGEIDCLTVSQVQGNRWPVVSLINGASTAKKFMAKHRDYFLGFEEVVLLFDMDEPGREAAMLAAQVLGPRAKIAELPLKDANDMLVAGRTEELVNALWKAKPYRPDGIVSLSDIAESVGKAVAEGKSWTLPTLSTLTYGRREGEVWVLAAGTGIGKTDFLLQESANVVMTHRESVGLFFLESTPQDVALRLAGKVAHKTFHVPDGSWTDAERNAAVTLLADTNRVFLYNNYGMSDWDRIAERIRFLHHNNDVRYFVVDNLTAFAAGADDERRELERVMGEAAGLAQELGSFIWIVSHLATPDGVPHENGGKIMLRHLKGSRGIAAWAHYVIGIERDQQAEDITARQISTVRMLKDRFTGRSTGKTFEIKYDTSTGIISETGPSTSEGLSYFPSSDSEASPEF